MTKFSSPFMAKSPLNNGDTRRPPWMGQKSQNGEGDTRKKTPVPKPPVVQT
jgi:hypothetical protein